MNCTTFEEEWASRAVGSTVGSPPVVWSPAAQEHLQNCVACQKKILADQVLLRALPLMRRSMPSAPSTATILESLNKVVEGPRVRHFTAESQPTRSRARYLWPAAAVVAAASLIVAVLAIPPNPPQPTVALAPASPEKQEASSRSQVRPEAQPLRINHQHSDHPPLVAEVDSDESPVTASVASLWREVRTNSVSMARATVSPADSTADSTSGSPESGSTSRSPAALETLVAHIEPSRWVPFRTSPASNPAPPPTKEFSSTPSWIERSTPVSQQVTEAFKFLGKALPAIGEPAS